MVNALTTELHARKECRHAADCQVLINLLWPNLEAQPCCTRNGLLSRLHACSRSFFYFVLKDPAKPAYKYINKEEASTCSRSDLVLPPHGDIRTIWCQLPSQLIITAASKLPTLKAMSILWLILLEEVSIFFFYIRPSQITILFNFSGCIYFTTHLDMHNV